MEICTKCKTLKKLSEFMEGERMNGSRYRLRTCKSCYAKKQATKNVDKRLKVKREPKIIPPEFVRTSIVSTGNVHTVIATIRKGYKLFRYEEKFAIHRKAVLFVEKINEDPRIADQYLDKSKPVKLGQIDKLFSIK